MPVEWGILAASTATWAVKKVADLGAGAAWKDKVEPAFKKSGLDHELTRAYEAGFRGRAMRRSSSSSAEETVSSRT